MKYIKSLVLTGTLLFSALGYTSPAENLKQRLSSVTSYSANFNQTVTSAEGKVVQSGSGTFQVKRPNLFCLVTQQPQEISIISDGKTLWYYDPFVEQVTARHTKDAIADTPFILLTNNDQSAWEKYSVTQEGDNFTLIPTSKNSPIKRFQVRVEEGGFLRNFSITENDGQSNLYILRNMNNMPLEDKLFRFSVPKGVTLDDQRK